MDKRNWMYRRGLEAANSIRIGNRYGHLVVEKKIYEGDYLYKCLCRCDCGNKTTPWARSLKNNATVSCGCFARSESSKRNSTHGKKNSKIYAVWNSMKERCNNHRHQSYSRYGGRGISYCPEWEDFNSFYKDMGDPPVGKSLDRIDNDKGYFKENCRWASYDEQANNRNTSWIIEYLGEKESVFSIWEKHAKPLGLGCSSFYRRLHKGMSIEEAITKPRKERRPKGSKVDLRAS